MPRTRRKRQEPVETVSLALAPISTPGGSPRSEEAWGPAGSAAVDAPQKPACARASLRSR